MKMNELPLQELFTRLREAGLTLGIDEYQLLLQSLQGGFGIADKAALKRLCQTLWVKSAEEKSILEYHFEQVMVSEAVESNLERQTTGEDKIDRIIRYVAFLGACIIGFGIFWGIGLLVNRNQNPTNQNPTNPNQLSKTDNEFKTKDGSNTSKNLDKEKTNQNEVDWLPIVQFIGISFGAVIASGATFTTVYTIASWGGRRLPKQQVDNDNSLSQNILQAAGRKDQISYSNLTLSNDYLPLSKRQVKQMWRFLRRPVREGKATELDVEATIKQIGHQGLLLTPVLVPPRVNRAKLLLLIDQDGSMVPFHSLSHRFVETALGGGRLGSTGIYYFHNCPIKYLYRDPYHQKAELLSDILTHVCSEQTAVLIFSDAGAARGAYSQERYKLTQEFLTHLQQRVRHIAWLNPIPCKRWLGTTAGEIASFLPMFEVSRGGLQDAISILRGHPTNFEGRRK